MQPTCTYSNPHAQCFGSNHPKAIFLGLSNTFFEGKNLSDYFPQHRLYDFAHHCKIELIIRHSWWFLDTGPLKWHGNIGFEESCENIAHQHWLLPKGKNYIYIYSFYLFISMYLYISFLRAEVNICGIYTYIHTLTHVYIWAAGPFISFGSGKQERQTFVGAQEAIWPCCFVFHAFNQSIRTEGRQKVIELGFWGSNL